MMERYFTARKLLVVLLVFGAWCGYAQNVNVTPTITPALFTQSTSVTIEYDVTGTPLASLNEAWAWVWLPGTPTLDATSNVNPAISNTSATTPAKFTKSTPSGHVVFTLTFTPSTFFSGSITGRTQIGMLLKANDWAGGQTVDFVTTFWDGSFQVQLTSPLQQPLFVSDGETIHVAGETPVVTDFTLRVNGTIVHTENGISQYSHDITASDAVAFNTVTLTATAGANSDVVSFNYIISQASPSAARPSGIIDGINYDADPTKVTLSLWAPLKTSVYVVGDFTNWEIDPDYLMKRDGEHFWLEVTGLTSGVEYGYQYLVDESLFVGDPYADKILDPEDVDIPSAAYPNLKSYPNGAHHTEWYFNRVPVLQTNQAEYAWQVTDFERPSKEKLVIYEMLIRDYFGSNDRNYQNLIDTIGYFKKLGVNAIELMPVTEFNGNNSWGYNPTFMFAPDKYYGTKNKLKEFIDVCHQNGIAVILDMVMNQQDLPNPYALMYFNFTSYKPAANNPWFNVDATHPFNVFNDMNHESAYTKEYLDTVNYHWLHDYKFDGLRFDLSKGFTQTNNPNDVGAWGAYDASRISIFKRMADVIWSYAPEAYVILEHFADNSEEKELAEYRAGEGKGMMLWANFNNAYAQNAMGYNSSSDFNSMFYPVRGWTVPHAIGYMESHDEERIMYKNLAFGNTAGTYTAKDLSTALERMKATTLLFYTIPGPKMLWEFGELGYDKSINTCADGVTINNDCRLTPKPVLWNYTEDYERKSLQNHVADLIRMHHDFDVFSSGTATISTGSLTKQIRVDNVPFTTTPSDSTEMNAHVVANMDMTTQTASVSFAHTGTWFDYYADGAEVSVTSNPKLITLKPGEFKLFTDVKITNQVAKTILAVQGAPESTVVLYPNPVADILFIEHEEAITSLTLKTLHGASIRPSQIAKNTWNVSDISPGLYIAEVVSGNRPYWIKVIKK